MADTLAAARTKLSALAAAVDRFVEDRKETSPLGRRGTGQVWLKDVEHFYAVYRAVLTDLKAERPDLFGSMPDQAPDTSSDPERLRVFVKHLQGISRDAKHCLDLLPPAAVQTGLTVTREGLFFAGQRTEAMKLVLDIVALAKTKLEVIDGYLDLGTLSLLIKEPAIEVEVITKPIDAATASAIAALVKGKKLTLRASGKDGFHDRFICVDGVDYYHFGASIKDAGSRGFMFSRVEEPAVIKALRDEWTRVWSSAAVII